MFVAILEPPMRIFILSDVHYACAAEKARGLTEIAAAARPITRLLLRAYRRFVWRRDPFACNHLLDAFTAASAGADLVVANGDYSCDTAFVGVSDPAAFASATECLGRLRGAGRPLTLCTVGDHELGKMSLAGGRGGLRWASLDRVRDLGLEPFWQLDCDRHVLMGVTSSLIALPVYEPETLPEERLMWQVAREQHLGAIRTAFSRLHPDRRVILFCHDPTALPFLWRDEVVRSRLDQVEHTVIGHLHSDLFFQTSRVLMGMPPIHFLGNAVRRMSVALREARLWKPFRVSLCPALGGIELIKDGGYLTLELDSAPASRARICRHRLAPG